MRTFTGASPIDPPASAPAPAATPATHRARRRLAGLEQDAAAGCGPQQAEGSSRAIGARHLFFVVLLADAGVPVGRSGCRKGLIELSADTYAHAGLGLTLASIRHATAKGDPSKCSLRAPTGSESVIGLSSRARELESLEVPWANGPPVGSWEIDRSRLDRVIDQSSNRSIETIKKHGAWALRKEEGKREQRPLLAAIAGARTTYPPSPTGGGMGG